MKAVRTIKLKIAGSTKADRVLAIWLTASNWLSKIVFDTKELNSNRLQRAHYAQLREMGLQAQLACSACKVVCATYKSQRSNKRWSLTRFSRPVIPLVLKRDFNRTRKGVTLWGEVLTIRDPRPLPDGKWLGSNLRLIRGQWFLSLTHETEIPEPKTKGCIVGVDMGIKRMLVATNSANSKPFFFHGGELNHRRSCIRRTRAAVQSVGSKSSRRLLRRMSGNEAAVTEHLLHVASKALVGYAVEVGARKIVVEELTNIRDGSVSKGKDLRSRVHRWPYANARFKITYKAEAVGIAVESVSPRNTSRACHKCGHVSASSRKGLHFCCQKCGHKGDADQEASKNIRARSVSIACNAGETGICKAPQSIGSVDLDSGPPASRSHPLSV